MTTSTSTSITIERAVPLAASVMISVSILLVALVSPWWLILTGFVAANLALYSAVGWCPASLLMAKLSMPRAGACAR